MEEQWEFEYERIFGDDGLDTQALRQTDKSSFKAGWDAALAAVLERFNATTQ
jgi:hypothetical protein